MQQQNVPIEQDKRGGKAGKKKNQEQAWNETTTGEERTRLGGWIYMMRILQVQQ